MSSFFCCGKEKKIDIKKELPKTREKIWIYYTKNIEIMKMN